MLPHSPPVPVAATWDKIPALLRVTFDRDLDVGAVDHGNWFQTFNNVNRNGVGPAAVAGRTMTCVMGNPAANIHANVCHYRPPPPDITSQRAHVPAAAFEDYPLVAA